METEQNLIQTTVAHLRNAVAFVGQNPYLQALVVVVVFFVAAWLADRLITRGVVRLVRRTRSAVPADERREVVDAERNEEHQPFDPAKGAAHLLRIDLAVLLV